MITVEEARTALRISTTRLDDEIQELIYAATLDLHNGGVPDSLETEQAALFNTAVRLYLRWQYNYEGRGEAYGVAYRDLKDSLAMVTPKAVAP